MPPVRARVAQQYSPIRHLARAIWLNHDPARCWLAAFTIYYDASGTELTGRPLVLAGLLSTELKWRRFEREWREFLASYSVPYLHMKEYAFSRGPFATWKGDEEKRAAFLREGIKVIKRRIHMTFVSHVMPEDYQEVDKLYDLRTLPEHLFSVVSIGAVNRVTDWVKGRHPGCPLHHVFEAGDAGLGVFFRHAPGDLSPSMSILPARDPLTGDWFTPFQAADLVAYEFRLAIEHKLAGKTQPRKAFHELVKMLPTGAIYLDRKGLIEVCKRQPEMFPPRLGG
jgi:hypothetical protein